MKKKNTVSKIDFTENQLPSTRYEVFADCMKINKILLVRLGFRLLLFCLPLIISCLLMDVSVSVLQEQYFNGEVEIEAIYSTVNSFNLINVFLWGLIGLGCAGCFKVIRRLIWQEPIFINNDFFDGIKQNWRAFVLIFMCAGFAIFVSVSSYMGGSEDWIVQNLSTFTSIIFLLPILVIMMGLYNVYNITLKEAIYNSFIIYVKNLFQNLLMTLIIALVFGLVMITGTFRYLLFFILPLFIVPIMMVGVHLYLCYLFDIHINQKSYPDYVDKGVYRRRESN